MPVTAIGDSQHDIGMLKAAEFAYAPANCAPILHELAKQGQVETLLPVMFQSLRFNLFAYEVAYSLAQQRVFFTRVEKIIGWHRHLLSILGSWRSLCILSKQMCAVNCGCAGVTGELPLRAEPTVAQVEA